MLEHTLPDDAFYYFVVADHAAAGQGLSFDGATLTNGFHPLWALCLIPIYMFISNPLIALRAALLLGVLCDLLAGVLLAGLAGRLSPRSAAVVLFLYLLNPYIAMESVNGLETALASFLFVVFLWALFRVSRHDVPMRWAIAGGCAGLAFLARTDLALIIIVIMSAILGRRLFQTLIPVKNQAHLANFWMILTRLGAFAAAGALVVAPWLLWNWRNFGSIMQSSAVAVPELAWEVIQNNPAAWDSLQAPVINYTLRLFWVYPGLSWLLLILSFGLALIRLYPATFPILADRLFEPGAHPEYRLRSPLSKPLAWTPALGAAGLVWVHALARWYPRNWYFIPLALSLSWLAGLLLAHYGSTLKRTYKQVILALSILFLGAQTVSAFSKVIYPGQAEWLEAAESLRQELPPGSVIGVFNAGILAYFSGHTIINLDGVVDWAAIQARRNRDLLAYLQGRGAAYLMDRQALIWDSFYPYMGPGMDGIELIETFGSPDSQDGQLGLYRLK